MNQDGLLYLKEKIAPYIRDYKRNGIHGVGISDKAVQVYYKKNSSVDQKEDLAEIRSIAGENVAFTECDMARIC